MGASPPSRRIELVGGPQVERAFGLSRRRVRRVLGRHAVGVLGGIEAPVRDAVMSRRTYSSVSSATQLPEQLAGRLRGFEQREDELRLVVQHLLEVRHAPLAVDRVAVEAAADVVAHAAERHRAQRVLDARRARRGRRCARARAAGTAARRAAGTSARRRTRPTAGRRPAGTAGRRRRWRRVPRHSPPRRASPRAGRARRRRAAASRIVSGRRRHARALVAPQARELVEDVDEAGPCPTASVGGK